MKINIEQLDRAQARAKMSNKELLEMAGISNVTLWNIKKGRIVPRPATVGRLASALGVDVSDIVEEGA